MNKLEKDNDELKKIYKTLLSKHEQNKDIKVIELKI